MTLGERALAWVRPGPGVLAPRNVRIYEGTLLAIQACERLREVEQLGAFEREHVHWYASLLFLALWLTHVRPPSFVSGRVLRRVALLGFVVVQLSQMSLTFPWTGNHLYLSLYLLLFLTLLNPDEPEERELLIGASRWMAVVVFFWAGLQKVVHGAYFQGETLTYLAAFKDSFALGLRPLFDTGEWTRVSAIAFEAGAGPFRTSSWPLLVISNLTYVTEIGVALALLVPALRPLAVLAGIVFLAITEAMALELFFGMVFINTLVLFTQGARQHWVWLAFGPLLAWILLMKFGFLPAVEHT